MIYTSITNNYDNFRNDIKVFNEYNEFKEPRMNAKIYKVLPHLFMDEEYSVWIDGNIILKVTEEELIEKLRDKDIAVVRHPARNCIYDEAKVCLNMVKMRVKPQIMKQVDRYRKNNYPENAGLGACCCIIRRHTEEINQLNEKWWAEICRGSHRDQLSFPYVFKNKVNYIDGKSETWLHNIFWDRVGHRGESKIPLV